MKLAGGDTGPIAIGGRAGGAGMKYAPKFHVAVRQCQLRALKSEIADSDHPFGLESGDHRSQMFIAGGKDSIFF